MRPGDVVLGHAASGGVGLLLCQWAKALGARVIGTVSSEAKAELARANGCDAAIVSKNYVFSEAVKRASNGRGADVVYDGLGKAAAKDNLEALARFGEFDEAQWRTLHDVLFSQRLMERRVDLEKALTGEILRDVYRKPLLVPAP